VYISFKGGPENGHNSVVKLLLAEENADPDPKNKSRPTPLLPASANRHKAVVNQLLA